MAKPDLDDGYLRVANELFAALACADFTKGAMIVLREVFAQIFRPKGPRTAVLSPLDIARRTGFHKQHIVRAIRELTDSGVIAKVNPGEYRFIKDYESWTRNGGGRRLDKVEMAYAYSCRKSGTQTVSQGNDSGTQRETIQVPAGNDSGTQRETIQVPAGNDSGTRGVPPPRTPLCEARASEDFKEDLRKTFKSGERARESQNGKREPESEPESEFREAVTLLRSLDVTQHLATALEMYADTPNVTSLQGYQILHAAHRLMAPNKPKSWEYFLATARRITREEVDHASTHASTNGQAPLLPRKPDRIRKAEGTRMSSTDHLLDF